MTPKDKTIALLGCAGATLALLGVAAAMAGFPNVASVLIYGGVAAAATMMGLIAFSVFNQ